MGLADRALVAFDGVNAHALDATRRFPVTDRQDSYRRVGNGVVLGVPTHACHHLSW